MRLVRAILALVIGLSVAMLPAAGFAVPVVGPAAQASSAAEAEMMTSTDMAAGADARRRLRQNSDTQSWVARLSASLT